MAKEKGKTLWAAALATILLLFCLTACTTETPPVSHPAETPPVEESVQPGNTEKPEVDVARDFSCYTQDQNGHNIYGYASEEVGVWYLFVPGSVDVADLTLYVSENVQTASSGTLDTTDWTVAERVR